MKSFIANPKTTKMEVVEGDHGSGLLSYSYDAQKVTQSDISQILVLVKLLLNTLDDTVVVMEPVDEYTANAVVSIKNRSKICLGIFPLSKKRS